MADEEAISPAQSPLVAVTFQRNVHRKEKYLEAEPKALGITQIGLSVYKIICVGMFQAQGLSELSTDIPFYIASLLIVIAGNMAVAAKNLHLPTIKLGQGPEYPVQAVHLVWGSSFGVPVAPFSPRGPTQELRACLGMQIVACGASIFNIICSLIKMEQMSFYCWRYYYDNESTTTPYNDICQQITNVHSHFYAGGVLIQVTLLAISATLAAYSCKVVNCCGPAPKIPVISIQTPPSNSVENAQKNTQE
ncbi:uncharacterized protein LOC121640710 isoform X1 [Melanotaenia boesemani]|uniref:uncharacterized protein LOC121640710 isoform X1 n=1 Tax=Melanotaenia boesemani TaxID=1250792 RepID=UPI001C05AF4F|nr:uncharacterized protein LOC121640710 isoform X1 [Melanotaenia boesemani]